MAKRKTKAKAKTYTARTLAAAVRAKHRTILDYHNNGVITGTMRYDATGRHLEFTEADRRVLVEHRKKTKGKRGRPPKPPCTRCEGSGNEPEN